MNSHAPFVGRRRRVTPILCEFTKEPYERDDILQKRPIILRSLLTNGTIRMMEEACHTYKWFTSHVTHSNESRHMSEWVMSHIWMSHVTQMNESRHTYECVMSHIWMRHVTHMNASCHTYEWVMSHIWMSHVTHLNESRHTSEWVTSHIW